MEECARLTQGIGPVEDDDAAAVSRVIKQLDGPKNSLAIGVGQVQRVLLHQLQGIDVRVLKAEQAEHLLHNR